MNAIGWLSRTGAGAPSARGIKSFRDWRFYLVAALLVASTLCLARDPYFLVCGEFVYRQGVVVLLLALVIAAAFTWETPIFGKPAGANLLLQVGVMIPFALLVTRLCATEGGSSMELTAPSGFGFWQSIADTAANLYNRFIPRWITDLFRNWHVTLLFLLALSALCLRRIAFRAAAILLLLLTLFFSQLNRDGSMMWMILGALTLISALSFMFCRYDRMSYYENVLRRIRRSGGIDEEKLRAILQVMEYLYRKGRISENAFRAKVKECYSTLRRFDDGEIATISAEVAGQMVNNYDLTMLRNDGDGIFLMPEPTLFLGGDNLLSAVSVLPRVVFVCGFALLWVMMPVDLIPDGIPFVGVLDDLAVTVLCGVIAQRSATQLAKNRE